MAKQTNVELDEGHAQATLVDLNHNVIATDVAEHVLSVDDVPKLPIAALHRLVAIEFAPADGTMRSIRITGVVRDVTGVKPYYLALLSGHDRLIFKHSGEIMFESEQDGTLVVRESKAAMSARKRQLQIDTSNSLTLSTNTTVYCSPSCTSIAPTDPW